MDDSLWSAGQPSGGFGCDGSAALSSLEGPDIDMRRLVLDASSPDGNEPGNVEIETAPDILTSATVETDLPRLLVATVEPAPASGLPAELSRSIPIFVQYHCRSEGEARVTLRLFMTAAGGDSFEACVSWRKACTMGFAGLRISEGAEDVMVDGMLDLQWQQRMQVAGTSSSASKFLISHPRGIIRLQPPTVDSDQQFLLVDVRGPFLLGASDSAFEVSSEPIPVTVLYTCDRSGTAEVVLTFTKNVLGSGDVGEHTQLKWRKHCGLLGLPQLKVQLWSDSHRSRTVAVDQGEVATQFQSRCRHKSKQKAISGRTSSSVSTSSQPECLVVPATDVRTSLELGVGDDTIMPLVTVDPRIVKVTVKNQVSQEGRSIDLKYVCFKDTTTTILVTLQMPSHRPLDITWVKVCRQPKNKVGSVFTAQHAVTIGLVVVAAVAAAWFACLCLRDEADSWEAPRRPKAGPDFDCELDNMSQTAETVGRQT